jgi:hypothetical protein
MVLNHDPNKETGKSLNDVGKENYERNIGANI